MRVSLAAASCTLLTSVCHATAAFLPPGIPLTTATVSVAVTYDQAKDIFVYSYTLYNSKQSVGSINSFQLDIATATGGHALRSDGLLNSAAGYSAHTAPVVSNRIGNGAIPVGFQSNPAGWDSGSAAQLMAVWYDGPHGTDILPGQSLSGFGLTSHGPPGIRRFTAKPAYDPNDFLPSIDEASDDELQQMTALAKAIPQAIQSQGYTVGPDDPASLDPAFLIKRLSSLIQQSVSLRWLAGNELVERLDKKLEAAQDVFARSPGLARAPLREFIREIQEQRERQRKGGTDDEELQRGRSGEREAFIDNNAFILLKVNADFVISKLPSAADGDRGDEGRGGKNHEH